MFFAPTSPTERLFIFNPNPHGLSAICDRILQNSHTLNSRDFFKFQCLDAYSFLANQYFDTQFCVRLLQLFNSVISLQDQSVTVFELQRFKDRHSYP